MNLEIKAMYGRSIVPSLSQGNIILALIITVVAVFFYYDGLQVYIYGEIWTNLYGIEDVRSTFYLGSSESGYMMIRPVEYAIEDLIHFIFGLDNPLPFHAIALGLHIANSILVFLILKRVINSLAGLSGALLFTSFFAHPEVVTYHFGLSEALRGTFCLSCVILFYGYRGNPTGTNYLLTLGAFILALGSKESSAIILPPLMYLVDRYIQIESRDGWCKLNRKSLYPYIPFIATSFVWILLLWVSAYLAFYYPTWQHQQGSPEGRLVNWAEWPINFYLSAVASFNLCLLKGPGYGTLFLVLSFVLSFLPLFDKELKRRIILLWMGWLVTIIPLIGAGMHPRYLYITSAFSMAIFAACIYHLIAYVVGRLRLKEAYVTFLIILVISALMTTNFFQVGRHVGYIKGAGRVSESLLKPILTDFPKGTLGIKLVFINLPWLYEPPPGSGYIGVRHPIFSYLSQVLASLYGRRNVGATYEFVLPELPKGKYHIVGRKLSPQEFEELAMERDTRVIIFNPLKDIFLDVTGKNYNSLRELLSNN